MEFLLQCRGEGWGWGRGFFQKKIAHDRSDWVVWGSLRDRFLEVAPQSRNNIAWLKINPTASHSFASGGAVLVILVGSARGPSIYTLFSFYQSFCWKQPAKYCHRDRWIFSMRWRDPFVSRALWASLMLVLWCLWHEAHSSGGSSPPRSALMKLQGCAPFGHRLPQPKPAEVSRVELPHPPYARTARAETEPRFTAWRATRLEERRGVLQLRWRTCAMPLSCSAPSSKVFILMRKNAELPLNVLSQSRMPLAVVYT